MKKTTKLFLIALLSGLLYFFSTYPLRDLWSVFTVTDVRPGCVFILFSSVCFGPAAAFGCAIGNAIADYLVGESIVIVIEGIFLQFLYGYVPYKVWKAITKGDDHSYRIDSSSKFLKIALVSFIFALLSSVGVGLLCYMHFNLNPFDIGKFVFLNNFTFPMLFGYPIMIAANIVVSGIANEKLRKLSMNEIIIICSSIVNFIGIANLANIMYKNAVDTFSNYNVWNNIYLNSITFVNCISLITLIILFVVDTRNKSKIS